MTTLEAIVAEEWRPIPGAEGWYSVSDLGRVRSEPDPYQRYGKRRGRILRLNPDTKGYLLFKLCVPGHRHRTRKVHRVVAEVFLGPAPPGMQVNHKNGDKTDNRAANLEYVTCAENIRHCWANGLHDAEHCRGENSSQAKLNTEAVLAIRRLAPAVGVAELARTYGVTKETIWLVLRNRTWRHV